MDERTLVAAAAMQGILTGMFAERPSAKPPAPKVAEWALSYADALIEKVKSTPVKEVPQP